MRHGLRIIDQNKIGAAARAISPRSARLAARAGLLKTSAQHS
jgi:hypothetical protein